MGKKKSRKQSAQAKALKESQWRRFEELVADIQRELSPEATVTENDKIMGTSGILRQVDVSVRTKIGSIEVLVAMDAKSHGTRVDINTIGAFKDLADDIKANKAAIVASKGFTDGAKKRAKAVGIDCLSLLSTGNHPWATLVKMPALCEIANITEIRWSLKAASGSAFKIQKFTFTTMKVFDSNSQEIGTLAELVFDSLVQGKVPFVDGRQKISLGAVKNFMYSSENKLEEVLLEAEIDMQLKTLLGEIPLKEVRGMENAITGDKVIKSMTTEDIEFKRIFEEWKLVSNPAELVVKPICIIRVINSLKELASLLPPD
ncbi:MAG: restriction endonuclease [Cyanobacteria bacterium SZAS TMP-1]|nr:restriction endonuclease [Cyanobacteria bacterium SZAS TMP-1]